MSLLLKEKHCGKIECVSHLKCKRRGHSSNLISSKGLENGKEEGGNNHHILIFGGESSNERILNSIEIVDCSSSFNDKNKSLPPFEVIQTIDSKIHLSFHCSVKVDNNIYFFGGFDGYQSKNQLLKLNLKTMKMFLVKRFDRYIDACSMNVIGNNDKELLIFGGWDGVSIRYNDLFVCNLKNKTFKLVVPKSTLIPSSRCGHTIVIFNGNIPVLFGGNDGKCRLNDVYTFNFTLKIWKLIKTSGDIPSRRSGHQAKLVDKYKMFVFGGFTGKRDLSNSLFILNLHTNIWEQVIIDFPLLMNPSVNQLGSESFIIIGGFDCYNGEYSDGIMVLNLRSNKFDVFRSNMKCNLKYADLMIIFL